MLLDTGSGEMWFNDYSSSIRLGNGTSCGRNSGRIYPDYYDYSLEESVGDIQPFSISHLDGNRASGSRDTTPVQIGDLSFRNWVFSQTLGIADLSSQCTGILGIGFSNEAQGELTGRESLVRNLRTENHTKVEAYSLVPSESLSGGSILFGAINHARVDGSLTRLPMVSEQTHPSITITNITTELNPEFDLTTTYTFIPPADELIAVIDIGSVLTYLPEDDVTDLMQEYQKLYGTETYQGFRSNSEIRRVSCNCRESSRSVHFTFSSVTIEVLSYELILKVQINGEEMCIFGVASTKYSDGQVILGYTFLRSAYVVLDLEKDEVQLAPYKIGTSVIDDIRDIEDEEEEVVSSTSANNSAATDTPTGTTTGNARSAESSAESGAAKMTSACSSQLLGVVVLMTWLRWL